MGSPISSVIANLIIKCLESNVIEHLGYRLLFYKRYVDDVITAVHKDDIDDLVHSFNQYHPSLKFTFKFESNNKISFLDMVLINKDDNISVDWYHEAKTHVVRSVLSVLVTPSKSTREKCYRWSFREREV